MFFTQEDYEKIAEYLKHNSIKDTQFPIADLLTLEDFIPVIADGINAIITPSALIEFIKLYYKACAINYHEYTNDNSNTSLETVLSNIKDQDKIPGLFVTFKNTCNNWVLYLFKGLDWDDINSWDNVHEFKEKYEVVYSENSLDLQPSETFNEVIVDRANCDGDGNRIVDTYLTRATIKLYLLQAMLENLNNLVFPNGSITLEMLSEALVDFIGSGGNVVNNPDDEDLMSYNNALKFADKEHNQLTFSGKGRVFLRKNMADGLNLLEQNMIDKPNTIYIVLYDYCLNGNTIVIPDNSTLLFIGGSLNNGKVVLNNTLILPNNCPLEGLINTDMEGTFAEGQCLYDKQLNKPKWFNGTEWLDASGVSLNL